MGQGCNYYRARYYHPALQRFISEDPIGFNGGDVNLYAYVANNPISRIDPLGLWGWSFGIIESGSAEAGIGAVGARATGSTEGDVVGGGSQGTNFGGFAGAGRKGIFA